MIFGKVETYERQRKSGQTKGGGTTAKSLLAEEIIAVNHPVLKA